MVFFMYIGGDPKALALSVRRPVESGVANCVMPQEDIFQRHILYLAWFYIPAFFSVFFSFYFFFFGGGVVRTCLFLRVFLCFFCLTKNAGSCASQCGFICSLPGLLITATVSWALGKQMPKGSLPSKYARTAVAGQLCIS